MDAQFLGVILVFASVIIPGLVGFGYAIYFVIKNRGTK